jgi:hypothetical protein
MARKARNVSLDEADWPRVDDLCWANNCFSTRGSTKGKPSVSVLLKRLIEGDLVLAPAVDKSPAKPLPKAVEKAPVLKPDLLSHIYYEEPVEEVDDSSYELVSFDDL